MTTSELERRLAEVLQEHAEEAMNETDTRAQLDNLENNLESDRRRRLVLGAGALAVAAAVAVAVILASTLGDDSSTSGTDPAAPPRVVEPVGVATGFMEAFAAYDEDQVASYLADGTTFVLWTTPPEAWSLDAEIRWTIAAGVEMLPGSCQAGPTTADGTEVVCPFDFHALGSEGLNRGPFADNEVSFTIADGKIVRADSVVAYRTNGFSDEMWEPFADWVAATYPEDAAHMYKDGTQHRLQATDERAAELWAAHVPNYVRAVQAGTAE